MKNNKITAVYARTSSEKQEYQYQIEAARPYLNGIPVESVQIFIDAGFSGSSKPPQQQKLIELIRKNLVDTLIIYDRSRLTNNLDTYLELVNLIHRHKIKVIFTATALEEHRLGDMYTEGIRLLFMKIEGIMLSNRLKDVKKYNRKN
ncbi:recombinase family protein [Fredinandcohnia humi]